MLDKNIQENIKNFVVRAMGVPFCNRGRDWTGWDCWGLIWRAYQEMGLPLPCLGDIPALQNHQGRDLFESISQQHQEVAPNQEQLGDVAVFRGRPVHVGLVIAPGLMIHVEPELATYIEPFRIRPWKQRILGIYRHVKFAGAL